jgi:hypothetical protein
MWGWVLTYTFVCGGWILFRASSLSAAWLIVQKIVGAMPGGVAWAFLPLAILSCIVAIGHGVGYHLSRRREKSRVASGYSLHAGSTRGTVWLLPDSPFFGSLTLCGWLIVLFLFTPLHRSPFIYFRF